MKSKKKLIKRAVAVVLYTIAVIYLYRYITIKTLRVEEIKTEGNSYMVTVHSQGTSEVYEYTTAEEN